MSPDEVLNQDPPSERQRERERGRDKENIMAWVETFMFIKKKCLRCLRMFKVFTFISISKVNTPVKT